MCYGVCGGTQSSVLFSQNLYCGGAKHFPKNWKTLFDFSAYGIGLQ